MIKISNQVLQNMQGSCNYNMKWCEFVGHKTVHVKDCLQTMNFASILTYHILVYLSTNELHNAWIMDKKRNTHGQTSNHVLSWTKWPNWKEKSTFETFYYCQCWMQSQLKSLMILRIFNTEQTKWLDCRLSSLTIIVMLLAYYNEKTIVVSCCILW